MIQLQSDDIVKLSFGEKYNSPMYVYFLSQAGRPSVDDSELITPEKVSTLALQMIEENQGYHHFKTLSSADSIFVLANDDVSCNVIGKRKFPSLNMNQIINDVENIAGYNQKVGLINQLTALTPEGSHPIITMEKLYDAFLSELSKGNEKENILFFTFENNKILNNDFYINEYPLLDKSQIEQVINLLRPKTNEDILSYGDRLESAIQSQLEKISNDIINGFVYLVNSNSQDESNNYFQFISQYNSKTAVDDLLNEAVKNHNGFDVPLIVKFPLLKFNRSFARDQLNKIRVTKDLTLKNTLINDFKSVLLNDGIVVMDTKQIIDKIQSKIDTKNKTQKTNNVMEKEQSEDLKRNIFCGNAKEVHASEGKTYLQVELYKKDQSGENGLEQLDKLVQGERSMYSLSVGKLDAPDKFGNTHYIYGSRYLYAEGKDKNSVMTLLISKNGDNSLAQVDTLLQKQHPGKDLNSYFLNVNFYDDEAKNKKKDAAPDKKIADGSIYLKDKEDNYIPVGVMYKTNEFIRQSIGEVELKVAQQSKNEYFEFNLRVDKIEKQMEAGLIPKDDNANVFINWSKLRDSEERVAYVSPQSKEDKFNEGTVKIKVADLKECIKYGKAELEKNKANPKPGKDPEKMVAFVNLRGVLIPSDKIQKDNANILVYPKQKAVEGEKIFSIGKGWSGDNMIWKKHLDNTVTEEIKKGDTVHFMVNDPILSKFNGNTEQAAFGTVSEVSKEGISITSACGTFSKQGSDIKKATPEVLEQFNHQYADLKERYAKDLTKKKHTKQNKSVDKEDSKKSQMQR